MNLLNIISNMSFINSFTFLTISVPGVFGATALVGGVGAVIGILLGIAGKKLEVPVDEKLEVVLDLLPGVNCGACGYPGCDGLAKATVEGKAPANACTVANSDTHKQIAEVMGTNVEATEKQVAFVKCAGTCDKTKNKLSYYGLQDCRKAALTPGEGPKQCNYGCMGYGSCVKVCQFDAIHIVDGIALVDKEKCTACGLCIEECPKDLIEFVPYNTGHFVQCNSRDKGKDVKKACSIGCIGCKLCEKACDYDAVHVTDNLALIDYDKCTNCGECAKKCPTKVILSQLLPKEEAEAV